MTYTFEQIKRVYCDISVSGENHFACYATRVYDNNNNLLDKYTGTMDKRQWKIEKFETYHCELMVCIMVMEAMPEGSQFTVYTDHGGVVDCWTKKKKKESLGKLIKYQTIRDRFHAAYNRVECGCVRVDSIHTGDLWDGKKCTSHKIAWHEATIEQVFHLDCDRDCAEVLSDYRKLNKFLDMDSLVR